MCRITMTNKGLEPMRGSMGVRHLMPVICTQSRSVLQSAGSSAVSGTAEI